MTGEKIMEYTIDFTWDDEACVWIATSKDVPGLVLESGSFDALIERVRNAIPELVKLNRLPEITGLRYKSERYQSVGV